MTPHHRVRKMAAPARTQPAPQTSGFLQSGDPMSVLEESLLSMEKLDRTSPELWPECIPGVSDFILNTPPPNKSMQPWTHELDSEDTNLLHQFGSLTAAGLIAEVKKLKDVAYQLGLEEAKEMTRGKYLKVLTRRRR